MNTTRVSLSDPDQKYMPDGKSCVFGSDPYGGRCDNHVCKAKKSDITATLSPEVLSRWISENWQVVLGLALGGIFLGKPLPQAKVCAACYHCSLTPLYLLAILAWF